MKGLPLHLTKICVFRAQLLYEGSRLGLDLVSKADGKSEVRAKKLSLTLNLGTNDLKVTVEPPPMVEQAGCLQGQGRSAATHPSSSHARRCLIRLSCDNRCTRYTTPLADGQTVQSVNRVFSSRQLLMCKAVRCLCETCFAFSLSSNET
ncbi:hypothetical protein J6590_004230 [Homalodisca vitripennis]|nr:hypothetical protein J6590_004230 [Homalodisca vitripennis]